MPSFKLTKFPVFLLILLLVIHAIEEYGLGPVFKGIVVGAIFTLVCVASYICAVSGRESMTHGLVAAVCWLAGLLGLFPLLAPAYGLSTPPHGFGFLVGAALGVTVLAVAYDVIKWWHRHPHRGAPKAGELVETEVS